MGQRTVHSLTQGGHRQPGQPMRPFGPRRVKWAFVTLLEGRPAMPRRTLPLAPYTPYRTSTPLAPKGPVQPRQRLTRRQNHHRSRWQQGVHRYAMGSEETRSYGTQAPGPVARNVQSPSHSLRSCSAPAGSFTRFFEISCRRFEMSIRRPEVIWRDAKPKAEPSAAERNASRPTGRWGLLMPTLP
jgi:hypothetical protein